MKTCLLSLTLVCATLVGQAPPPAFAPDTVVARVEGKDITVADLNKLLEGKPPQLMQLLRQDPARAINAVLLTKYVSGLAENLKLADQSPWKERIVDAREQILLDAMTFYERNHFEVSNDTIDAYYKQHVSNFQQAAIKAIKINFKPAPAAASPNNLEAAAKQAFETAHSATDRSEADAKKLAEDVARQLRAGGDFAKLVTKYSEDESKDFGGDYPPVKPNGTYPADIKKAVFALKVGDVSDPIRQSNCFYVIRVTGLSTQPLNDVREDILQTIRQDHLQEWYTGIARRFTPTIVRPEFFLQPGAPKE